MKILRASAAINCIIAFVFIAGCSNFRTVGEQNTSSSPHWHGRFALRVQAEPNTGQGTAQSFSAAFELQGSAQQGALIFYTPLGSTVAAIYWAPGSAVLKLRGESRDFDDLNQLVAELLGTNLPVAALFLWLDGQTQEVAGWQVDLSQKMQGKILASRLTPAPPAELILLLDN